MWLQVVDRQLLAVDGLDREQLQRLLLENSPVTVVSDLETLETLVWETMYAISLKI